MPIVSKQQLAISLGMATATIDRWIARHPDFPVVAVGRGGTRVVAWQFDLDAVRSFMAHKRAEVQRGRERREAMVQRHSAGYLGPAG
jgi:phage terminase Nu1 subunit (DNA packaging protein)